MRNRQAVLFLALAAVLGLGAAIAGKRWLERQAPGVVMEPVETIPVVIARMDVAVGSPLEGKQLELVGWPRRFAPAGAFSSVEGASGRVPRRPLAKGEPVLEAGLLPPGSEAGLVAVIQEGMRAVSVKVDPVVGVAGFVKPGARVDVVATLRRIDLDEKLPYTEAILQDIRVLAIDQRLEEAANGEPHLVSVVTLEVEPDQAQRLTYISHEGRLQLALRNPADHDLVKTQSTGVADLISPRWKRSNGSPGPRVQVMKGSDVSTRQF